MKCWPVGYLEYRPTERDLGSNVPRSLIYEEIDCCDDPNYWLQKDWATPTNGLKILEALRFRRQYYYLTQLCHNMVETLYS